MKSTANTSQESNLNYLLITVYVLAFLGVALLLYGALPMLGEVLFELKENAAARMLQ